MNELSTGHKPMTGSEVAGRIFHEDPAKRITITPWTGAPAQDFTLDLRLGTKFIELRKSSTTFVDPLAIEQVELRRVQSKIEVPFGQYYTLHPGQLVLSGTLEYIALPEDLGAYVVTRSTYGRLGLITATAVYAHPGFRGCLTLEMVNYGDVPLRLYPGLRVAQLVFHHTHPDLQAADVKHGNQAEQDVHRPKYSLATEPEFPKVDQDADRDVLLRMRGIEHTVTYSACAFGKVVGLARQTVRHGLDGSEVVAVADAGYTFREWSDGATTAARTDRNVQSDMTFWAVFGA